MMKAMRPGHLHNLAGAAHFIQAAAELAAGITALTQQEQQHLEHGMRQDNRPF